MYVPFDEIVKFQAHVCFRKMPSHAHRYIEEADLVQEGRIEAVQAARAFRFDRGVQFNTYLTKRLMNLYASILRGQYRPMRNAETVEYDLDAEAATATIPKEPSELLSYILEHETEEVRALAVAVIDGRKTLEAAKRECGLAGTRGDMAAYRLTALCVQYKGDDLPRRKMSRTIPAGQRAAHTRAAIMSETTKQ